MPTTPPTQEARIAIEPGFAWDGQSAYLFDIDGTLLRDIGRTHMGSFAPSIRRVTGFEVTLEGVPVQGNTDTAILREACRLAGISAEVLEPQLAAIYEAMRQTVAEQMVRIHRISPELAAYHVRQMAPKEVKERFWFYVYSRSHHQMSTCPICLKLVPFLVTDHDHKTGFVRGEICQLCNTWLGVLESTKREECLSMWKTKKRLVWQRWADENAGRIHEHLQKQTGIVFVELKRAVRLARQIRSSARLKACGQGCDAVRIPQKTGNGLPARSPAGAGESRANTRSNSQPKTGDLCGHNIPDGEHVPHRTRHRPQHSRGFRAAPQGRRDGTD